MFVQPIFNQNSNRPFRWSLQIMESGETMDRYWVPEEHYTHWTKKENGQMRDVFTSFTPHTHGNFIPMRRKTIGFLTTYHKEFYEDGKYVEVFNDPINYIIGDASDYSDAFTDTEQRIGNYRMGVRRHVTHLGGTISEDELDMLEDKEHVPLESFPLMPPLPAVDYLKPFRTKLITSDVGYIDYIKTAHSDETTTARYAYQSKQSTGFRHFIFDAGNINMKYESTGTPTVSTVTIEDLETVVDVGIEDQIPNAVLDGQHFIPDDGDWIIVNVPGQHIIRSTSSGLRLQMYTADFTAFQSEILLDKNGDIVITAGDRTITIDSTAETGTVNIT